MPASDAGVDLDVSADCPMTAALVPDTAFGIVAVQGLPCTLSFSFVGRNSIGGHFWVSRLFMSFFDIQVLDLRGSLSAFAGTLGISGGSSFYLSPDSAIRADRIGSSLAFSSAGSAGGRLPAGPLETSLTQQQHMVSVAFEGTTSFSVQLGSAASGSEEKRTLVFGGVSSIVCPLAQVCSTYACPRGWAPRPEAAHTPCMSRQCTDGDAEACCEKLTSCISQGLNFAVSTVMHNNLDGQGPEDGEPGLTFGDILPQTQRPVNMEIFATSPYPPLDSFRNGLVNQSFARINLSPGSAADFSLRFVDNATWRPVQLSKLYLSFFGLAGFADRPQLTISGFGRYFLTEGSDIEVTESGDGVTFVGKAHLEPLPPPQSPGTLDTTQRRQTVTFLFDIVPTAGLSFSLAVLGGTQGHDFLFAGMSPLVCSSS